MRHRLAPIAIILLALCLGVPHAIGEETYFVTPSPRPVDWASPTPGIDIYSLLANTYATPTPNPAAAGFDLLSSPGSAPPTTSPALDAESLMAGILGASVPAPQAEAGEGLSNPGENIYVAENGNDIQDGTLESPLRTFRAALIRALRLVAHGPVTIWLREGTYPISETLIVGNAGSATFSQLTICAYGDEKPVITGDIALTGWTETTLNGSAVWSVPYYGSPLRALYGEDGARQPCRWPKQGTLAVRGSYNKTISKLETSLAFYASPSDMPFSLEGAIVRLLHWWKDELSGVKAYNASNGLLTLNRSTSMAVRKDDRFWLENVSGVPLAPGEFLHDQRMGILYYAPLKNESIDRTTLYAGTVEQLLSFRGLSNIEFSGITFARTGWNIPYNDSRGDFAQAAYDAASALFFTGGQNIRLMNCTFRNIGAGCVRFDYAVRDAVVSGCTFENIGGQAVYVHGQNRRSDPAITESITIQNNHINGYGQVFLNAAAVLVIHARDIDIAYNEIHSGTYTAISAGWVWGSGYNVTQSIRIENNLIYSIGQGKLSDLGAIYLLGSQPNTVVSGNIIRDVVASNYGGWGIYLDEGSANVTVTNNLVYRCSAQGFHLHMGGANNNVENNIFAFNLDGQIGASGGKGAFSLSRNVIVGDGPYLRAEKGSDVRIGKNVVRSDGSIFVDAAGGNFNIVSDQETMNAGFIPWIYIAGRYTPLE